jgi:hypothetical protein
MKRALTALLIGSAVILSLAGCPAEPSSSGAHGTVVKRHTEEARNGPRYYEITVKEDGGKRDTGRVSKSVYKSCQVGDRWPACKKEAEK